MSADKRIERKWAVEQKAQIVVEGCRLSGPQLTAYLEQQGIQLAHFERWRFSRLYQENPNARAGVGSQGESSGRGRNAPCAKKTIESHYQDEDDDTGE